MKTSNIKKPLTKNQRNRKYYAQTANYSYSYYTEEECIRILKHDIPDRQLSAEIGHSMKSIQRKREKLKAAHTSVYTTDIEMEND